LHAPSSFPIALAYLLTDYCLTLIPVIAALLAIVVYSFAFLILIIYTTNAIV
jgi:hypothetical protein